MGLAAEAIAPGLKPALGLAERTRPRRPFWQNEPKRAEVWLSLAERTQARRRVAQFGRTNPSAPRCGSVWQNEPKHAHVRGSVWQNEPEHAHVRGSAWQNEPKREAQLWQNEPEMLVRVTPKVVRAQSSSQSSRAANQGLRWMAAQPILRYSASLTVLLIKYAT
jgi:hypothetical protein